MFLARRVLGGVLRVCQLKAGAQPGTQTHGVQTPDTKAAKRTGQHVVLWGIGSSQERAIFQLRLAESSIGD